MLVIDNITKTFGSYCALDSVSLHVRRGTIFGLLGPNGAGKTTLLRIINHILRPASGRLPFDGHHDRCRCDADWLHARRAGAV